MSDRDRIEIDFAMAMEQARLLEGMAGELCDLARGDLSEAIGLLKGGFGGENGAAFLK